MKLIKLMGLSVPLILGPAHVLGWAEAYSGWAEPAHMSRLQPRHDTTIVLGRLGPY